mgnify:CR=1 FL=1
MTSQPIQLIGQKTQQHAAESEILAKAHKLGWSADEIEMLLFTYGPALNLDAAGKDLGTKRLQRLYPD